MGEYVMSTADRDSEPDGASPVPIKQDIDNGREDRRLSPLLMYPFAVVVTFATFWVRNSLGVDFGNRPLLILFVFPIILSACLGGLGPGLIATILSTTVVDYFLIPPIHSFYIAQTHDIVQLVMLFINGAAISVLTEALHRLRRRAEVRNADYLRTNRLLREEAAGRKKTEAALRESETLFRAIFNCISDSAIFTDRERRIRFVNPAFCSIFGYTDAEVSGRTTEFLYADPADFYHVGKLRCHTETTVDSASFQMCYRRRDGTEFWCESIGTAIKDSDGIIFGNLGLHRDITERKRVDEALRESESRYRELVEKANSAIVRWSREGIITFFNEYAQTFFGYLAEEAVGSNVSILLPERESNGTDLTGLVQDILDQPDRFINNVNENLRRDGSRVWMTWTNYPILDENGKVVEILAVGSDITARKWAEDALQESETRYRRLFDNMLEGFAYCRMIFDSRNVSMTLRHVPCEFSVALFSSLPVLAG